MAASNSPVAVVGVSGWPGEELGCADWLGMMRPRPLCFCADDGGGIAGDPDSLLLPFQELLNGASPLSYVYLLACEGPL